MKQLIYIAGPYRGRTIHDTVNNIRIAEHIGIEAIKAGFPVLIPHKNTSLLDGVVEDEFWLDMGLLMLSKCDAVVLCPGWANSDGTLAEIDFANKNNIPVFNNVKELKNASFQENDSKEEYPTPETPDAVVIIPQEEIDKIKSADDTREQAYPDEYGNGQ